MARIPDEEIARLKKEIPIERLVTGFGVELKRQGKDLLGAFPGQSPQCISRLRSLSTRRTPESRRGTSRRWGNSYDAPKKESARHCRAGAMNIG